MSSQAQTSAQPRRAVLYRMVMDKHLCPYGLKARDLLKRSGFEVEDCPLRSHSEVQAFKAEHAVKTTPQVFIDGQRIGGYEDLQRHLGQSPADPEATSYTPVIALFSLTGASALALSHGVLGSALSVQALQWFVALSMVVLGLLKLQDVERFATMFLNYDLLAQRWVRYSYIYPFAEAAAGVMMLGGVLMWLAVPLALTIGTIGAVSVFKAVYIDRRTLKCACVGGASKVPLGFVSLTENLMMIAMALWMGSKILA